MVTGDTREQIGKKVAWLAIISNIILMVGKIFFGWTGASEAVLADGFHSAADVVASMTVLAVVGIANKPPDKDHPFGHGKAEVLSEAAIGIILFLVSAYIIVNSVMAFLDEPGAPELIAFFAALGSFIFKQMLYRYSMKIGKRLNSKAIVAIAYDHKADIIASLAASVGVILSIIGAKGGYAILLYADPAASIIVAFLILKISVQLMHSSTNVLMEKNVDSRLLETYREMILTFEQVKRIDQLRGRDHGHYILLDIRLSLDYRLTIKEGHDIAHDIQESIRKNDPNVKEVFIHVNPYVEE